MYEELIKAKDDEIRLLKAELERANSRIDNLLKPTEHIIEESPIAPPRSMAVGSRRITPKEISRMEAESTRKYWEGEVKRREALTQENGNVTEVESINQ